MLSSSKRLVAKASTLLPDKVYRASSPEFDSSLNFKTTAIFHTYTSATIIVASVSKFQAGTIETYRNSIALGPGMAHSPRLFVGHSPRPILPDGLQIFPKVQLSSSLIVRIYAMGGCQIKIYPR